VNIEWPIYLSTMFKRTPQHERSRENTLINAYTVFIRRSLQLLQCPCKMLLLLLQISLKQSAVSSDSQSHLKYFTYIICWQILSKNTIPQLRWLDCTAQLIPSLTNYSKCNVISHQYPYAKNKTVYLENIFHTMAHDILHWNLKND